MTEENIDDLIKLINTNIKNWEDSTFLNEKLSAISNRLYYLTSEYNRLANILLNKDEGNYKKSKNLYYKYCRGIEFDYWISKEFYPHLRINKEFNLHGTVGNNFHIFILCDHDVAVREILNEMEHISQFKDTKQMMLFNAFKFILNDDLNKSQEYFDLYNHRFDKWTKVQYMAVKGILENDVNIINQGIKLAIKEDKSQMVNQPEFLKKYSPKATAVAKLAMKFGLQPDLSSKLINQHLLIHEPMLFEDINDLFEKINIVPIKSYDLKNY